MDIWQRQLLTLLSSIGWLLSAVAIMFFFRFYIDPANPLRNEVAAGVAMPIVYGAPVWFVLSALALFKWQVLTKRQKYISGLPIVIASLGFLWSLLAV